MPAAFLWERGGGPARLLGGASFSSRLPREACVGLDRLGGAPSCRVYDTYNQAVVSRRMSLGLCGSVWAGEGVGAIRRALVLPPPPCAREHKPWQVVVGWSWIVDNLRTQQPAVRLLVYPLARCALRKREGKRQDSRGHCFKAGFCRFLSSCLCWLI